MSKKLKFRGFVNGQKFDSVEEYNKVLTKAIAAGEDIEASSETYTDEVDTADLYPGLEGLDNLNCLSELLKEFCVEEAEDLLGDYAELVKDAIANLSDKEREDYIANTNKVMNELGRIYNKAKIKIEGYEQEFKELNDRIATVKNMLNDINELKAVANVFGKCYEALRDEAVAHRPQQCNCGCAEHTKQKKLVECECKETTSPTEQLVESFTDFLDDICQIADEIFKK